MWWKREEEEVLEMGNSVSSEMTESSVEVEEVNQTMDKWIYVLLCADGTYYVGVSGNPDRRLQEHNDGHGAEYTKTRRPVTRVSVTKGDRFDEDKKVKELMSIHGIDKVRGGSYSSVKLTEAQMSCLKAELCTAEDTCLECGSKDHFVKNCPIRGPMVCHNCKEPGHRASACPYPIICHKCQGSGHRADQCTPKVPSPVLGCELPPFIPVSVVLEPGVQIPRPAPEVLMSVESGSVVIPAQPYRAPDGGCHACGAYGHMSRECPRNQHKGCFACGATGHQSAQCPTKLVPCSKCGHKGHASWLCRQR